MFVTCFRYALEFTNFPLVKSLHVAVFSPASKSLVFSAFSERLIPWFVKPPRWLLNCQTSKIYNNNSLASQRFLARTLEIKSPHSRVIIALPEASPDPSFLPPPPPLSFPLLLLLLSAPGTSASPLLSQPSNFSLSPSRLRTLLRSSFACPFLSLVHSPPSFSLSLPHQTQPPYLSSSCRLGILLRSSFSCFLLLSHVLSPPPSPSLSTPASSASFASASPGLAVSELYSLISWLFLSLEHLRLKTSLFLFPCLL